MPDSVLEAARESGRKTSIDSSGRGLHEGAPPPAERRREQRAATVQVPCQRRSAPRRPRRRTARDLTKRRAPEQEVAARDALARAQRLSQRQTPVAFTTEEVQEARTAITEASDAAKRLRRRSRRRRRVGAPKVEEIRPGVSVWVQGLPMPAEVISAPDRHGDIDVSLGGLRARVAVSQVTRIEKAALRVIERGLVPPAPARSGRDQVRSDAGCALPQIEDSSTVPGRRRCRASRQRHQDAQRRSAMLSKHPWSRATTSRAGRGGRA